MSQQSGHQGIQPGLLLAVPNNPQARAQEPPPTDHSHQMSLQPPLPTDRSRRVSTQESPPTDHSRRVSIQEPLPTDHSRQVSIQEPLPTDRSRRVSIQEPPPTDRSRRVSIQEPPPTDRSRRVSIQEPLPTDRSRRVSIQEPLPTDRSRRVSIQEPLPTDRSRRVSIQEPLPTDRRSWVSLQELPPTVHSCRASVRGPLPTIYSRRASLQEPLPTIYGRRASIQEPPPTEHSRRASTQGAPSTFQTHHFSILTPPSITHSPLGDIKTLPPVSYSRLTGSQDLQSAIQSFHLSTQDPPSRSLANVDVSPSINNPNISIKPVDSIIWSSQESLKGSGLSSQRVDSNQGSAISSHQSGSPISYSRSQRSRSCNCSLLPMGCWMLLEAKRISRLLGLVLSLAGMVVISLITLGQPWIHFHVPLKPAGDPAGPQSILITTIFFLRCPDIACLYEYDKNAYLLDFAWAFFLIASLTSLCLCIALINTIFFSSSTSPIMDFSFFVASILTVTSMILGVLFYLLQAQEFLQENTTYRLGISFYLAWIGIFFFLITGFFSYLNYMNFWSILALQAIWT